MNKGDLLLHDGAAEAWERIERQGCQIRGLMTTHALEGEFQATDTLTAGDAHRQIEDEEELQVSRISIVGKRRGLCDKRD